MAMQLSRWILSGIFLLILSPLVAAQDAVRNVGDGFVNWSTGDVVVYGYGAAAEGKEHSAVGRLQARRAAVVDAYRNLAEVVHGVKVTSSAVVKDMMLASDVVMTSVNQMIKGAKVIAEEYVSGIYRVQVSMPMRAKFVGAVYERPALSTGLVTPVSNIASAVLRSLMDFAIQPGYAATTELQPLSINSRDEYQYAKKLLSHLRDNQGEAVDKVEAELQRYEEGESITGLVIDASAIPEFEMATIPRIRSVEGELLYPTDETSYDEVLKKRPASYDFSVDDAVKNKRVAHEPIVIASSGIYKSKRSDLVVPSEYASVIKRLNRTGPVNQAKVIIVVAE